jgi:prevent-host-death family protein
MKTVRFTDFRKRASDLITEVEHGESLVLLRRGKPVAEIIPFSDERVCKIMPQIDITHAWVYTLPCIRQWRYRE